MANIAWSDTKKKRQIGEVFQSYYGPTVTKNFAKWLLGLKPTDSRGFLYTQRFGSIKPVNAINELNKNVVKMQLNNNQVSGKVSKLKEYLEQFRDQLLEQENEVYTAFGCSNFAQFRQIWEGFYGKKTSSENGKDAEKRYWLNYHLNLLTGSTQRLILKGRSQLEQIFSLIEIELESIQAIGITDNTKKIIRETLLNAGIIEAWKDPAKNRRGAEYIPTQGYYEDSVLLDAIQSVYADEAGVDAANITASNIGDSLSVGIVYAIKRVLGRIGVQRTSRQQSEKSKKKREMNDMFVKVNFKRKISKNGSQEKIIAEETLKYLAAAREYKMTDEERKRWKKVNAGGAMTKYIKGCIEELCRQMFLLKGFTFYSGLNQENAIQGFFGELSALGKAFYNLKDNVSDPDFQVLNIGSLTSQEKAGKQMQSDMVISIYGKLYGFQAKNPFSTENGFRREYRETWHLGKGSPLYDILFPKGGKKATSAREILDFISLNVENIEDTTKHTVIKSIESFLYMYSPQFVRLTEQHVATTEFTNMQEEQADLLKKGGINNVFFIIRGEIFPSSQILNGMIQQCNYFTNAAESKMKDTFTTAILTYNSKIEKNKISIEDEIGSSKGKSKKGKAITRIHAKPYQKKFVKQDSNVVQDLLNKVMITSLLRIKIPSLQKLTVLKF